MVIITTIELAPFLGPQEGEAICSIFASFQRCVTLINASLTLRNAVFIRLSAGLRFSEISESGGRGVDPLQQWLLPPNSDTRRGTTAHARGEHAGPPAAHRAPGSAPGREIHTGRKRSS